MLFKSPSFPLLVEIRVHFHCPSASLIIVKVLLFMPRSLAKKQIACPANTLLEATGAHVLLQTQSDSLILSINHTRSPRFALRCAKNWPHSHTDMQSHTQTYILKLGWKPTEKISLVFNLIIGFSSSTNMQVYLNFTNLISFEMGEVSNYDIFHWSILFFSLVYFYHSLCKHSPTPRFLFFILSKTQI